MSHYDMTKTAAELATALGYTSAQALMGRTKNATSRTGVDVSDTTKLTAETAKNISNLIGKLSGKVFEQSLEKAPIAEYVNFANLFDDQDPTFGNSKEYIFRKETGFAEFSAKDYIPPYDIWPSIETHTIGLYQNTVTQKLAPSAYKYKKNFTIRKDEWMPYFLSGKLNVFVGEVVDSLRESYRLFKFHMLAKSITTLKPAKTIVDTGTVNENMFMAFANEIIPNIMKMLKLRSEYNLKSTSKVVTLSNKADLIVLMSEKNESLMRTAVLSQMYHGKLWDVKSVVGESNLLSLGGELDFGKNIKSDLKIKSSEYINDNTVYVLNKNACKVLTFVQASGTQYYIQNLTTDVVVHVWAAYGFLPWGQVFKYTNPKLSAIPSK